MKKFNMTNVTRAINKAGFKLKKHSPEILVVAGVVGAVASAIMACKATMKLNDTLNDTKERVEDFHADETNYTEEEGKKTLTLIYSKAALDIAKLYGPYFNTNITCEHKDKCRCLKDMIEKETKKRND